MDSTDFFDNLICCNTVGITFDFSQAGVSSEYVRHCADKTKKAQLAMDALERGEIANPSENRKVGHYWLRSAQRCPSKEEAKKISSTIDEIEKFASGVIKKKQFSKVLLIGVGGSALGPQLLISALAQNSELSFHFIDNTDPQGIHATLKLLKSELDKTLVVVTSKSGSTVETRNALMEVMNVFDLQSIDFQKHAIAITVKDSALYTLAQEKNWLKIFEIWDWVGGRTSLFSAVGLLPAALAGLDIKSLLKGAAEMDEITRSSEVNSNPAMMLALTCLAANNQTCERAMVVIPYCDRLALFGNYLQQLVMESVGKNENAGLIVFGNKGSSDQHAYIQQLRDGPDNFFATFISVFGDGSSELEVEPEITSNDYLNGFCLGTKSALAERGRILVSILIDQLDEASFAALIALYERTVGFYASFLGINAYDQPGVEAGKKAAKDILKLQQKIIKTLEDGKEYGVESIAQAVGETVHLNVVFQILEYLKKQKYIELKISHEDDPKQRRYQMKS